LQVTSPDWIALCIPSMVASSGSKAAADWIPAAPVRTNATQSLIWLFI
jgi:hypothetical protein